MGELVNVLRISQPGIWKYSRSYYTSYFVWWVNLYKLDSSIPKYLNELENGHNICLVLFLARTDFRNIVMFTKLFKLAVEFWYFLLVWFCRCFGNSLHLLCAWWCMSKVTQISMDVAKITYSFPLCFFKLALGLGFLDILYALLLLLSTIAAAAIATFPNASCKLLLVWFGLFLLFSNPIGLLTDFYYRNYTVHTWFQALHRL